MGLRVMTPRRRLRRFVFVLPPKLIVHGPQLSQKGVLKTCKKCGKPLRRWVTADSVHVYLWRMPEVGSQAAIQAALTECGAVVHSIDSWRFVACSPNT